MKGKCPILGKQVSPMPFDSTKKMISGGVPCPQQRSVACCFTRCNAKGSIQQDRIHSLEQRLAHYDHTIDEHVKYVNDGCYS